MADLTGIQISGLQTTPALSGTTEFAVQRQGIFKAEKVQLASVLNWMLSNNAYMTSINLLVNSAVGDHVAGTDPHGDRAYANSILTTHVNSSDPHGDRAYTNTQVTTGITNHTNALDPHGDRNYATSILNNHISASDPHGDRVFATTAANNAKTAANSYTDTKVSTEFTSRVGTSIAPLVSGKIPDNYLNLQVSFADRSSFPATGNNSVLYYDTTGNDIYKWNGSTYINATPPVDIGSLGLTTDNVPEGSNVDRQYLTSAKETIFSNKINNVAAEISNNSVNIYSRRIGNVSYIKNVKTDYPLQVYATDTDVIIKENTYNYKLETSNSISKLMYSESALKLNILENYDASKVYILKGTVIGYSSLNTSTNKLVKAFDKFNVDAVIGNLGTTEDLPLITSAEFSADGTTVSGVGVANAVIAVYDKTYTLIATTPTNETGDFSYTFGAAQIVGNEFYLHNTVDNGGSEGIKIYSPNLNTLKQPTNISISALGDRVRGQSDRAVTVTISDELDVVLATGSSDSNGFFDIEIAPALVNGSVIKINTVNTYSASSSEKLHTVVLNPLEVPYNVLIPNNRKIITGKSAASSIVTLKDNNDNVLGTATTDIDGNFTISLANPDTTITSYKINSYIDPDTSEISTIEVSPYYIVSNPPTPIPVLVSESFDFLSKEITAKIASTDIDLDITINNTTSEIELTGINNTGDIVKWEANIKIDLLDL